MSTGSDEYFSISPVKQNNPGDIIKGRTFRTLNVNRHLRIGDIPSLIVAALQMQNFQLGSRVYTQAQGSPMGSPLSPALCLMVVSVYEQIWFHTHRESISNLHLHALFLRYVDNRLVIIPTSTVDLPAYQILTDPDFYKSPIVLESEPDQEFLGFQLELNPFEMIYQSPRDLSQVLSPAVCLTSSSSFEWLRIKMLHCSQRSLSAITDQSRTPTTSRFISSCWF